MFGGTKGLHKESVEDVYRPEFVYYIWINAVGVKCGQLVPIDKYDESGDKAGIEECAYRLFNPLRREKDLNTSNYMNSNQTVMIMPVRSTYKIAPWDSKIAMVFCKIMNIDGSPFIGCSRTILERASDELKNLGYNLKFSIDVEFSLLKQLHMTDDTNEERHNNNLIELMQYEQHLTEVVKQLNTLGIHVNHIKKEISQGQYEIQITEAHDSLTAVENYYLTKIVINHYFQRLQQPHIYVSFLPVLSKQIGSASHCHISLWKGNENVSGGDAYSTYKMSDVFQSFLAGILQNYSILSYFMAPSPNSCRRFVDSTWMGTYQCWGFDNKEAPINVQQPNQTFNSVQSVEIRTFDHTANFYVAIAALISYGCQGIKTNLKLPQPVQTDPAILDESMRKSQNLKKIPNDMYERSEVLVGDQSKKFREIVGDEYMKMLVGIIQEDYNYFKSNLEIEEEVKSLFSRF